MGRMRVDSGAVQCHVLMRARVGACGLASTSRNSHAKEGSEPLQGVRPGERVHVSGCAWGAMRDVNPCAHRRRLRGNRRRLLVVN